MGHGSTSTGRSCDKRNLNTAAVSVEFDSGGWYITLTDQLHEAAFCRLVFCAHAVCVRPDRREDA